MKRLILCAIASFSFNLTANTIFYGSERELVSIVYGSSTILRFDEEIKTIAQASDFRITPADVENPDYRMLSIKPLKKEASNDVTFILANDAVIILKLKAVSEKGKTKPKAFYDFKPKRVKLDAINKPLGSQVSEVELMKAMIRRDKVVGYQVKNLSQKVRTGIEGIEAYLIQVYSGPNFHGYAFRVTNTSHSKNYALDLKSLTLGRPNVAILSQSDHKILYAHGSERNTILRIITKPTSISYAITLPVAPILKQ